LDCSKKIGKKNKGRACFCPSGLLSPPVVLRQAQLKLRLQQEDQRSGIKKGAIKGKVAGRRIEPGLDSRNLAPYHHATPSIVLGFGISLYNY